MPPDMVDKINLSFGRLIGLGRSAEYPEEHLISGPDPFDVGRCAEIVNRPVIYPDGDLQSCCCAGVAEFTVGNLRTESLAALFARMRARSHYRFIDAFGPKRLHEAVCAVEPRPRAGRRLRLDLRCLCRGNGRPAGASCRQSRGGLGVEAVGAGTAVILDGIVDGIAATLMLS